MSCEPHVLHIRKSDPVSRYQSYKHSWSSCRAPGEKDHKHLRWGVREKMFYHDRAVDKVLCAVFAKFCSGSHLRYDLYCVGLGVKLYSLTHLVVSRKRYKAKVLPEFLNGGSDLQFVS